MLINLLSQGSVLIAPPSQDATPKSCEAVLPHFFCRTCSYYSPSLFAGPREDRPPAVHQCCQNRGRCFPSGGSLNINGLPYWGVVLSTPQEGPHGRAAIRAALPQGEKLDRHPRPPIAEEPPKPAKPSRTCGQTKKRRGGRVADLLINCTLVGGVQCLLICSPSGAWDEKQPHWVCVRRMSNSSRTYINIYMATIWGQWRRLGGGKGEGLGALRSTQCRLSTDALKRICGNL